MRSRNAYKPLIFFGAALVMGACASQGPVSESGEEKDVGVSEAAVEAPEAPGDRHPRHRGGPDRLLRQTLSELDLSEAQKKTVDEAFESLRPPTDDAHEQDKKAFMKELAAQVRAGKIDTNGLVAKVEASKAGDEHRARIAAALVKVHGALTPAQRKEVVTKVEGKIAAIADEMEERAEDRHDKLGKQPMGPLGHALRGLDLTEDQRAAIDKGLADAGLDEPSAEEMRAKQLERRAKMKAMLDAFAAEGFDADAHLPDKDGGPRVVVTKMIRATAVIVPVLDAGQREKLANAIESGRLGQRGKHGKKPGAAPAPAD